MWVPSSMGPTEHRDRRRRSTVYWDKVGVTWSFRMAPRHWPADLGCHVDDFDKLLVSREEVWQKHRSHHKDAKRRSVICKDDK